MAYLVFDRETENHEVFKRFANPFSEKNWTVALGWKKQGDKKCSFAYYPSKEEEVPLQIDDDVTILIGHNIKFDLLFGWNDPGLKLFFKRGGRIWDTQYAEYLIQGMHPDSHMVSMDEIAEKYGGRRKIDSVKALWEMGMLTSQIDQDMLIDYLVGTEAEGRDSGDIGNTEKIFLGQYKRAKELGMLPMIMARMDGLLATTEMEFNGIKIDVQEAKRSMALLEADLKTTEDALLEYIPPMPDGLDFNWSSNVHVSCLIFGGTIKYVKAAPYKGEDGKWVRKNVKAKWPVFNGNAEDPETCDRVDEESLWMNSEGVVQDSNKSGKNKGAGRYKAVSYPGERKTKKQLFTFDLPGYTAPNSKWESAIMDGAGNPTYSVGADIITELGNRDIPFLKLLAKRQKIVKDLGTYYLRYDEKKKDYVGMLTCVMPGSHLIHHLLNHTSTVTSRLSSANPNLQNIPRGDTSEVKKMLISRFGQDGVMLEADYSQLEVVVQGLLSLDKNLCEDLRNKVDFHCKRVAVTYKIPYEDALRLCKKEDMPDHALWKTRRNKAKIFSFQRSYGAGAVLIAESTGLPIEEVKALIEAEEIMYPGVVEFNHDVEQIVKKSAVRFRDPVRGFRTFSRGQWQAPTGTIYSFRSYDAPKFLKDRGILDTFSPTELKNYPVQGTGGEIVQIILGRLWRHFIAHDNFGGRALLCNTVHDCVWIDAHNDVLKEVAPDVKRIMESVPEVLHELYGMDVPVPFPVELEIGPNLYDKHVLHI